MKKFNHLVIIYLICTSLAYSQQLVPILENPLLNQQVSSQEDYIEFREDETCDLEEDGILYIGSGETIMIPIGIDTVGLDSNGTPGTYLCIQCNTSPFGFANVQGDTLIYQANNNVQSGQHEFSIQYDDEQGTRTAFFNFIIRRQGISIFMPEIPLLPESSTTITADISGLSGQLVCSNLLECSSEYDGRDQSVRFSKSSGPDNTFTYTASRFGGIDSVCLVVCNEVATCDTFNYTFRILQGAIEELPIFDDFSYAGPFPDSTIWLDDDPFINRKMAIDPPSFGVATFDGLDRNGIPYGGGYGVADRLTSKVIRMNQYQNELVVLSYWLQRKGLGNKPEVEDSMVVEFKDQNGDWIYHRGLKGIPFNVPNSVIDTFQFYQDTIPDAFKHDEFQFRFVSYSDRTGIIDNWHLDYIRLDNSAISTFEDIAFGNQPGFILKPYSSMPYNHFIGYENRDALLLDDFKVNVKNFHNTTLQAQRSRLRIIESNSGTDLLGDASPTLLNEALADIAPDNPVDRIFSFVNEVPYSNAYPFLVSGMTTEENFINLEKLEVEMSYEFVGSDQVPENDFISTTTVLDNYFAYDDGTAEAGFIAQENNSIAVKFVSYIEDSLRAVQIHFPVTTTDAEDQIFDLRVYVGDLNAPPVYEALSLPVQYTSSFYDTLQGFTTYPLVDDFGGITPVYLPANTDFYISWTQISSCEGFQCIPVGFDLNTVGGRDVIWANLTGTWEPLDTALTATIPDGSLMLRAVVGNVTPFSTSTNTLNLQDDIVELYPNPSDGFLYVNLKKGLFSDFQYRLYNQLGQEVQDGPLKTTLDFTGLDTGVYILRLSNLENGRHYSQRVLISRN